MRSPRAMYQPFKALTSQKREREQILGLLTLSWFECLTSWWATDLHSVGNRRHWDPGSAEVQLLFLGSLLTLCWGFREVIYPSLHLDSLAALTISAVIESFSPLTQNTCKSTFYSVKRRFEARSVRWRGAWILPRDCESAEQEGLGTEGRGVPEAHWRRGQTEGERL